MKGFWPAPLCGSNRDELPRNPAVLISTSGSAEPPPKPMLFKRTVEGFHNCCGTGAHGQSHSRLATQVRNAPFLDH